MEKLCNKRVLSASLLEWTLGSTTTFIEAKENDALIEKAKKLGIELPSPDLAAFETVYCEVDKFNLNGVKFSKEVAKKGLNTLIGKQINWNHSGAHEICGYIIDSQLKEDKIYITGILFKSLFKSEFDEVVQLFADKKLFVSFELWTRKEDGVSVVNNLGNGQRELTEFIAHGCALLLINEATGEPFPPACPQAQVKKLLASTKVIEEAESIAEKIFEQDDKLVYAGLAAQEQPVCTKCKNCACQNEGGNNIMEEVFENDYEGGEIDEAKKLTTEQRNALPDDDFALIQEKDGKKIRRFPINDEAHVRNALARLPQAKDISEEEKKSTLAKILKKAKELNMTELLKKYEKAEEVVVEAKKVICPVCHQEVDEKDMDEDMCAVCKKKKHEKSTQETPEPAQVVETPVVVEAPVDATPVVEPIVEVKLTEATTEVLAPEVTPEPAQVVEQPVEPSKVIKIVTEETVVTTRVPNETGDSTERKGMRKMTTFFSDGKEEVVTEDFEVVDTYSFSQVEEKVNATKVEKDIEITNLKQELDSKNQEIATLKVEKVTETPPVLEVGNILPTADKYREIQDGINAKAFPKK